MCEESWRRGGTEKHGWEKGRQNAREGEKSTERKGVIRRVEGSDKRNIKARREATERVLPRFVHR